MTKNELLQAAIARCQELQKENPTGQLVYDEELTRLLQAFMESPVSDDEAMQLMEKEKESIDVSDLDWDAYEKPMTLMEKFPDVSPMVGYKGKVIVDEPEIRAPYIPDINWDNAMLPGTAGGLKRGELTVLAAGARQTGKTTLTADLIEQALERTTECPCVDCDGTEPTHIPECEYMADLHGSRERDRIPS